jgi:hypothetical protein
MQRLCAVWWPGCSRWLTGAWFYCTAPGAWCGSAWAPEMKKPPGYTSGRLAACVGLLRCGSSGMIGWRVRAWYPRFCCKPSSLSLRCAEAAPGLPGVTRPHRRSGDASEPAVVRAPCGSYRPAHPTHLALHQPAQSPGRRHCCRRRCALTAPFHPLPARGPAGLLSVVVLRHPQLARRVPPLAVSRGSLPLSGQRAESREVPLAAQHGYAAASDGAARTRPIAMHVLILAHM